MNPFRLGLSIVFQKHFGLLIFSLANIILGNSIMLTFFISVSTPSQADSREYSITRLTYSIFGSPACRAAGLMNAPPPNEAALHSEIYSILNMMLF